MKFTYLNSLQVALWTYYMVLRCPFKISTNALDILREIHDFPQYLETNSLTVNELNRYKILMRTSQFVTKQFLYN